MKDVTSQFSVDGSTLFLKNTLEPKDTICLDIKSKKMLTCVRTCEKIPEMKTKELYLRNLLRHRLQDTIRSRTFWSITHGLIKRQPCKVCGKKKSDAHHPDYSKPWSVVFYCPKHHKAIHRDGPKIKGTSIKAMMKSVNNQEFRIIQKTGRRRKCPSSILILKTELKKLSKSPLSERESALLRSTSWKNSACRISKRKEANKDATVVYMISRIMDNMTSEEIAKKLHCTAAAVYSWKSGERAPQYHARRAIAALYQSVK